MTNFWKGFEKQAARKTTIMDKIRAYLGSRKRGHSMHSIFSTKAGKDTL